MFTHSHKKAAPSNAAAIRGTAKSVSQGSFLLFAILFFLQQESQAQDELCSVCRRDCRQNNVVQELCCGHRFHAVCLGRWLSDHSYCPNCRASASLHVPRFRSQLHDCCEQFPTTTSPDHGPLDYERMHEVIAGEVSRHIRRYVSGTIIVIINQSDPHTPSFNIQVQLTPDQQNECWMQSIAPCESISQSVQSAMESLGFLGDISSPSQSTHMFQEHTRWQSEHLGI